MQANKLALIPIIVITFSILVTLVFDFSNKIFLNQPNLVFVLNLIFWSVATISIAYISAKSFIKEGSAIILIVSCSIIVLGLSLIISGWVTNFSGNYGVTIANIGILCASALQVLCSILSFTGKNESTIRNRIKALISIYIVTVVFVLALSALALLGLLPVFFTTSGPTLLRQTVLGSGILFFAIACILFVRQYLKSKASSLYWYALAIGLFSISLSSTFEVKVLGDVPTWLGRIGLYIGATYLLAAILSTKKRADGTDRASVWAEAFKANPEQFATLFRNMLDAFVYSKIFVDSNGKPFDGLILEVNEAFEKITGIKREDAVGKKITELVPGVQNDPAGWIAIYGRVAITGEPTHFENYLEPLKKWYHVSSYSPKKGYYVSIFEDITERKKDEEALKQSERKLEEYNKNLEKLVEERSKQLKDAERLAAIGATAGMVGHDIRNPLQAITGDLYLAKTEAESLPDSEMKKNIIESLVESEKNIDYINKIVQDLQDYARPLNPNPGEADLKLIIDKLLAKNGLPKNVKLTINVEPEARKFVADSDYLNRILYNLVTNAVQAMPKGGKLTIHVYKEANNVVLTVKDTGVGIPKSVQGKMFTPMFTTKSKGQGFGLPVVKRMTESLGGTVSFESEEGKGTTFIVHIPNHPKSENLDEKTV
jgi:signal transduction histidine kinase